ncbi:hypothetical protein PHLGIDRAFT_297735 [Phlebiopsis gigantea 11061_1 CR5-6]|uniref:F-box domain-containing protein n=1 Tax=Phlebiopsis gigantea (strain 11061_1 CR5-6) TaxID=745531 RepID=A0A0C3RR11_PHLG1|nr:hypothetical protein PHLGIDRAFT_297735 [Phlebiopsis gigantea 11061_1 CR5-6]
MFSGIEVQVVESRAHAFVAYARSCRLGPQYIRRIALNGEPVQHGPKRVPVTQALLVDLLACLPRLESLHLSSVLLEDGEGAVSATPAHPTPTSRFELKKLHVSHCGDANSGLSGLAACLGVLAHIGELHLHWMDIHTDLEDQEFDDFAAELARALPPVDAVVVNDGPTLTDVYLQALAVAPTVQCLRSLVVRSRCSWSHDRLGVLLARIGGGLRVLGLDLSQVREPQDIAVFCTELNLAACTQIEEISVWLGLNPDLAEFGDLSYASFAHVVASVPPAALRRVTLCLTSLIVLANATREDNMVDAALARFPALRELVVRAMPSPWWHPSELDIVRTLWPLTEQHARVIVQELEE